VITLWNLEKNNPTKVLDNNSFTIAEVYNYGIVAVRFWFWRQKSKLF
jgi:hypothetical protein